jgi:hypothetical protein
MGYVYLLLERCISVGERWTQNLLSALFFNSENVDLLCFRQFFPVMIYDGLESTVELRVIWNETRRAAAIAIFTTSLFKKIQKNES